MAVVLILGGCGGGSDGPATPGGGGATPPKASLVMLPFGLDVTFSDKMPGWVKEPGNSWPDVPPGISADVTSVKLDFGDGQSRAFTPDEGGGFRFTRRYERPGSYNVTLTVTGPGGSAMMRQVVTVAARQPVPLNDTGMTWCAAYIKRFLSCDDDLGGWSAWAQDARQGRDALAASGELEKTGFGIAGFDFTKLDHLGRPLPHDAPVWRCLRDNVSGLIWEVKTSDGGLHDASRNFHWYMSDNTRNGGYAGRVHRNSTETFLEDVNSQGWCGWHDWRLPTVHELVGLANLGRGPEFDNSWQLAGGALNLCERGCGLWTSQTKQLNTGQAMTVGSFGQISGQIGSMNKYAELDAPPPVGIILVRDGQ